MGLWVRVGGEAVVTNVAGSGGGAKSLWMGGMGERQITSRPVDTRGGGLVEFWVRLAEGYRYPWAWVDLPTNGVVLESTVDGGMTWTELGRYEEESFRQWRKVALMLPAQAQSEQTQLRWRQNDHSGTGTDHWALDEIGVWGGPQKPRIEVEPQSAMTVEGAAVELEAQALGSAPMVCQWWRGLAPVAEGTNQLLRLTEARLEQTGVYRAVLSNAWGMATSVVAEVTVVPGADTVAWWVDQEEEEEAPGYPAMIGQAERWPWQVTDLEQLNLGPLKVLLVEERRPYEVSPAWTNRQAEIEAWVRAGGRLAVHDASAGLVAPCPFLAGWSGVEVERGEMLELDTGKVLVNGVTAGPHGTIEESSLDGGEPSAVGYVARERLPEGALPILTMEGREEAVVAFLYPLGAGWVYYSTIPLSSYLEGGVCSSNAIAQVLGEVYGPNLIWQLGLGSGFLSGLALYGGPGSREVVEGSEVELKVGACGDSPLDYQWWHNLAPVAGATQAVLRLSQVELGQSGAYWAVVSNVWGSLTSAVGQVTVLAGAGLAGYYTDPTSQARGMEASLMTAGLRAWWVEEVEEMSLGHLAILAINVEEGMELSAGLERRLGDVEGWVRAGGRLVVHDGSAGYSEGMLVGLSNAVSVRWETGDVDRMRGLETAVTSGPFASIEDWTLDGGQPSAVGYVPLGELPGGAVPILTVGGNREEVVAFAYRLEAGWVYYSTIPVSRYVPGGAGMTEPVSEMMAYGYLPNVLAYMSGPLEEALGPVIYQEPEGRVVAAGSGVRLSVGAYGQSLEYEWWGGGGAIMGGTNAVLEWTGALLEQSGAYWAVVRNGWGAATSAVAQVSVVMEPDMPEFRVERLGTNGSRWVEHEWVTGGGGGGGGGALAMSEARVFYSGPDATGLFAADDLGIVGTGSARYDAMVSDLATGTIYSLGQEGGLLGSEGGMVTRLWELDGTSGELTGASVELTAPVMLLPNGGNVGIFAGYGRVVVHDGWTVYDILLPSGLVVERGQMVLGDHQQTEGWAYWGVAEWFGGQLWLDYVRDSQTVVRTAVPDGRIEEVAHFIDLGTTASWTVSVPKARWYLHYQGEAQFGGIFQTMASAEAQFYFTATNPPLLRISSMSLAPSYMIFRVATVDGSPLSSDRLAGIEFQTTTNLSLGSIGWSLLPVQMMEGMFVSTNVSHPPDPARFFRTIERP